MSVHAVCFFDEVLIGSKHRMPFKYAHSTQKKNNIISVREEGDFRMFSSCPRRQHGRVHDQIPGICRLDTALDAVLDVDLNILLLSRLS